MYVVLFGIFDFTATKDIVWRVEIVCHCRLFYLVFGFSAFVCIIKLPLRVRFVFEPISFDGKHT